VPEPLQNRPRGHSLTLEGVTHRFGSFVAVRGVELAISAGELVALLGPSGCGKTTLLRIISGFISQSEGRILFDGEPVDALPPNRRNVGIVFQNYALFPHMSVWENVIYGLAARGTPKEVARARVEEMLHMVHLGSLADRYPRQLSGGQQQRVAVARALAPNPKLLLLDEPFGALDKALRLDMQIEIKRIQREFGVTTILVTHDQEEALSMADRIAVMNAGLIEQLASPGEIYDSPATLFVNQFVGHTNLLSGRLVATRDGTSEVLLANGTTFCCRAAQAPAAGSRVLLSVRPERFRVSRMAELGSIPAEITAAMPLGPHVVYECSAGTGAPIKINLQRELGADLLKPGERIFLSLASPDACQIFDDDGATTRGTEP
jgi:putative spermidine/putrescine transport system ATP-binding protein